MPVRFCFISIQPSNWAPDFSARPAAFSLCSPLPARPCTSVPGSKIFTFPRPDFSLPRDRRPPLFAPRSPLGLVPPFRGAKSSHSRRRISPFRATGDLLSLLPAPREPLCLRFGEQNLHISAGRARPDMPAAPLPTTKEKHRATQLLLGAFLSSFSIIPIPLLPPAQS